MVALRLGLSMTALQTSIGALNDLVDAPSDAEGKPGKPIPAGVVSPDAARGVVFGGAAVGLGLAAPGGPSMLLLAGVVLAIGFAYDLAAKGTSWSWVPFAVGIPVLPVYGWFGVAGTLPSWFLAFLPMAALAGSALALANAQADIERDRASEVGSVAVKLGRRRSWWAHLALWMLAAALAYAWLLVSAANEPGRLAPIVAATGIIVVGIVLARSVEPRTRERAWQIEAVGAGLFGIAWVFVVSG